MVVMRRNSFSKIAQSTTEFAILLAVVATALIAMQVYIKRGLQGRLKELADQISPTHYEAESTVSDTNTTASGNKVEQYEYGVSITLQNEISGRTGNETVYPR
jgi:Flp pilus assembly pilin Flp